MLMAGDSLLADISLAIASTVQDGGRAVARLAEEPSIPRDEATRDRWRQRLARFDPEVIVILIGRVGGAWPRAPRPNSPSAPWNGSAPIRDRLLDPYVELLASRGAKVVWIGMPPVLDARRQRGFNAMNRAVRHLAEESTDLTYVPGDRILARPDGSWTAFLPGPQGNPQRVRRIDTTHLCADGAVRLARAGPALHRTASGTSPWRRTGRTATGAGSSPPRSVRPLRRSGRRRRSRRGAGRGAPS